MSDDYIWIQRRNNEFHKNGNRVAFEEEAHQIATDMCRAAASFTPEPTSFLDAGCRMGYSMVTIKDNFPNARVVGVDIVPEFVEEAEGLGDEVVCADLCALPFADRSFDWTLCNQVLEHTLDIEKAASELMRVTRLGIYMGLPLEGPEMKQINPSHYHFIENPFEWLRLFDKPKWELSWAKVIDRGHFNFVVVRRGA